MNRASGLEFGNAAADYERGRPDWPTAVLDALPLGPEAEVLDLAAGTGKLTRLLAGRYARVVAVEPDDGMRALIEGVESLCGTAEAVALPDGSVDAVFVAEAFHWFDGEQAVQEIARVLRPRGVLALMWNTDWEFDPDVPEEASELLDDVIARVGQPGGASYKSGAWRGAFEDSPFEPLRDERFPRELAYGADQVVSLSLSISSVASMHEDERAELGRKLRGLFEGRRTFRLTTELTWTRLA